MENILFFIKINLEVYIRILRVLKNMLDCDS